VSSSTSPLNYFPSCSSFPVTSSTPSVPLLLHSLSPPHIPRFSSSPYHFYSLSSPSSIHFLFSLFSRVFFHFTVNMFSILLSCCYPVPVEGHVQMDGVKFFFLDNQIFYWSALQGSVSARN
jgi:hypothetical protein